MLSVEHVSKHFGKTVALDDVSLECPEGTVLALCGENGAGKSTLMKILSGVIPYGDFEGRICLDDRPLEFRNPAEAEAQGIAFLPQELVYYSDLSVAENITAATMPSRYGFVRARIRDDDARRYLARVGLTLDPLEPMSRLPASEKQLVCIARALATEPQILILDEPTAALPRGDTERLFEVIEQLKNHMTTVLYISHHLSEVGEIADEVVVLRNGQKVLGPARGVTHAQIVQAMVGDLAPKRGATTRAPSSGDDTVRLDVRIHAVLRGHREVLRDIRFDAARGEVVGVAGLTGSGVAELLRTISGNAPGPIQGSVRVDGEEVDLKAPGSAVRAGVVFVPEDRHADGLVLSHDIRSNVLLGYESYGTWCGVRRPAKEMEAAQAKVAQFEIYPPDPAVEASKLSGGNQQKVMLARAGFAGAKVIVLAEPTRGVDIAARQAIHARIRDMAEAGSTVILASADISELLALSDRLLVMHQGAMERIVERKGLSQAGVIQLINRAAST